MEEEVVRRQARSRGAMEKRTRSRPRSEVRVEGRFLVTGYRFLRDEFSLDTVV